MKIAYSHLVQHLEQNPSIEQISDSLFQLGHEHEIDGGIFDMEFTPNRGDCLSISGLLRDLAVFYTVGINQDIFSEKINELLIDFENLSESICPQISFLKLEIDEVPEIYKDSLGDYFLDLSLNKNNFFTDISNYLSYETGQPTHCYDASKINSKLIFHEIEKNEEFETLLDKKIALSGKNAVFTLNNEVINLAGVVGGKSTSCSVNTKTVIVECAFFQPEAIIGKSVKYDIQSEASHKFERGVDPDCHDRVLRRFIKLVSEHANIKDMSIISYKSKDNPITQIPVNIDKINQIIGINISEKEYLSYLLKLGFIVEEGFIEVPSFRSDVKTQNDLAEELARVIGYDNIATSEISIPKKEKTNHKAIENKLRFFLLDHGFYEVINSPFVSLSSEEAIKVDNPLDSNREFLRTNITNSLVDNLLFNERRQKDSIKLFEISDVYSSSNGISKKRKLSIIASGRVGLNYEDFSKKINKKYLTTLFQEILPNEVFDFEILSRDLLDTKIKNEIVTLEVDIDRFSTNILSFKEISKSPESFAQYSPISDLPSSFKDISYSIKDYSKTQELQDLLLNYQSDILKNVYIFDYFKNEKQEEIKIGFRFVFQSKKITLNSAEIELVYNDIVSQSLRIEGISIPGM
ncbi:phenylalanine--tRNA ligase beta subunit-related protein [Gammaproteobacteria bacterium]|nr:phenylalanine--tRNA ligase beta subunit-related protein [Gammaproteobacteria bacterium]